MLVYLQKCEKSRKKKKQFTLILVTSESERVIFPGRKVCFSGLTRHDFSNRCTWIWWIVLCTLWTRGAGTLIYTSVFLIKVTCSAWCRLGYYWPAIGQESDVCKPQILKAASHWRLVQNYPSWNYRRRAWYSIIYTLLERHVLKNVF